MSDLNREQFEKWFDESGFYKLKETAWASWEASRECLVIELPEPDSDDGDSWDQCFKSGVSQCRAAIHAAGVKTK